MSTDNKQETAQPPQTSEQDYDHIDYSTAFRRELQRRQKSEEILRSNAHYDANKVHRGLTEQVLVSDGQVANDDIVFDVLPSFEMYNAFKFQTPRASLDHAPEPLPPRYSGPLNGSSSSSSFSQPQSRINSLSESPSTRSNSTSAVDSLHQSISNSTTPTISSHQMDDYFSKNILDALHKLPNVKRGGINITINVTKSMPVPFKPETLTPESQLKEYTSGDVVHGYVTIQNTTSTPFEFEGFHVNLEGAISIIDKDNKKQIFKKFLNMVDLSACWSASCISPSSNISYKAYTVDSDGSTIGLPNSRILAPNTTYKKHFVFKFPYNSLDTVCRHQQELHTLLPPSLGVDRLKKMGKYANIEINPVLNYGHSGKRGSPIVTRDFANGNLSVNYSINATLLGTRVNSQNVIEPVILQDQEYALRFIPFGFGVSLFSSRVSLENLKKAIEHTFKSAKRGLKLMQEGETQEMIEIDHQVKLQQLTLSSEDRSTSQIHNANFPLRNQNVASPDFSKVENVLVFTSNEKSLFKLRSDSSQNGLLTISSNVPKDGLPYISPALIRKSNKKSDMSTMGSANIDRMSSALSNNEKQKLEEITLDLNFTPSDRSNNPNPPSIKSIKAGLLVMNVYSSASIPIKLSSDIFLGKGDGDLFHKMTRDFKGYYEQYQELNECFNMLGVDIKKYVDPDILTDINAMKNLKNDNFFVPVFNSSFKQGGWTKEGDEFTQKLKVNLEFRDDLSETLVPTFQSCILTRLYCIQINIQFKGGKTANLKVPIRLRQFDYYKGIN